MTTPWSKEEDRATDFVLPAAYQAPLAMGALSLAAFTPGLGPGAPPPPPLEAPFPAAPPSQAPAAVAAPRPRRPAPPRAADGGCPCAPRAAVPAAACCPATRAAAVAAAPPRQPWPAPAVATTGNVLPAHPRGHRGHLCPEARHAGEARPPRRRPASYAGIPAMNPGVSPAAPGALPAPTPPSPTSPTSPGASAARPPVGYWGPAPAPQPPKRVSMLRRAWNGVATFMGADEEALEETPTTRDPTTGRTNVGNSKPWMQLIK